MEQTVNLIGAGHVGRVLGKLLAAQGFRIQQVLTRSAASAQQAVEFIGAGSVASDYGQLQPAAIHVLAVGDDQIVPACEALARAVPL
jgi:predicted dinucleotide-binding enzyme